MRLVEHGLCVARLLGRSRVLGRGHRTTEATRFVWVAVNVLVNMAWCVSRLFLLSTRDAMGRRSCGPHEDLFSRSKLKVGYYNKAVSSGKRTDKQQDRWNPRPRRHLPVKTP